MKDMQDVLNFIANDSEESFSIDEFTKLWPSNSEEQLALIGMVAVRTARQLPNTAKTARTAYYLSILNLALVIAVFAIHFNFDFITSGLAGLGSAIGALLLGKVLRL